MTPSESNPPSPASSASGGDALEWGSDAEHLEQVEARLAHRNRLLRTLLSIHRLLLMQTDAQAILRRTCAILVEEGCYRMAWIGVADWTSGIVRPVASEGLTGAYLDGIRIRIDDSPEGRGPTGVAIREGRLVVNLDSERNEAFAPWRGRAAPLGFRSSCAIPLRMRSEIVGAINVYAAEPLPFEPDELELLEELAGSVGFAMQAREDEAERVRAKEALRLAHEELERLLEERQRSVPAETELAERASIAEAKLLSMIRDELWAPLRSIVDTAERLRDALSTPQEGEPQASQLLETARGLERRLDDLLARPRVGARAGLKLPEDP
ncbi:MAG: GAF domain-containing protein [Myxococcales bacterium]|nr:GAF domain-containing protein [Myxococcales bacterium]